MSTTKATAEFILDKLGDRNTFAVRPMFGEYALYAKGKTVGFICDDTLFVKILPASQPLADSCQRGPAYPGSKDYYVIEEWQFDEPQLAEVLLAVAETVPAKKKRQILT
jgi:TfoX/Sxy family transcriptional regulator of competence genes